MPVPGKIVDVSSNNHGPAHFDWRAAKADGVIAAFVKADQDTNYTNPFYIGDRNDLHAADIPMVAYHFLGNGTPQAEAAHFLAVAGKDARCLDSETSTDQARQQAFLDALNLPWDEEMDYGSTSTLPTGVRALLWGAGYGGKPGPGEVIFQFTATGKVAGIQENVDISEWLGTQEQFDTFFQITPPQPPQLQTVTYSGGEMGTFSQAARPVELGGGEDVVALNTTGVIYIAGESPDWEAGQLVKLTDRGAQVQPSNAVGVSNAWTRNVDASGTVGPWRMAVRYEGTDGKLWENFWLPGGDSGATPPIAPWNFGTWVEFAPGFITMVR